MRLEILLESLQGKYPLAEVIKEVFSVIKLVKIVKKTFSTTSVYGYRGFGGAFNGNSTQLKKIRRPEVITDVFSSMHYSSFNASVRTYRRCLGAIKGECTTSLRYKIAPGVVLVIQRTGPL